MKDINYALVAKPHPNRYVVHKYWARKPHNVVAQYISSYSKPDDIVLDPFCGSGVTFCEALIQNRRAIALDLNPMACFITRNVSKPYSTDEIKEEFERIKEDVQDFILPKYQTKCRKNGHSANILATIFKKDKPVEIRYFCPTCNKKYADPPNDFDLQLLQQIVSEDITDWYPTAPLRYPDGAEFKEGTHKDGFDTVDSLFTKRNLLCLARLFKRIESIKSKELREVFEFAFTSMVHLASKMCPVANPEGKGHWSKLSATSFWSQHRFYLPDIHMESNVFMLFLSRINGVQGVLNAKEDTNNSVKKYEEAKSFEDFLQHDKNALIINDSALDLIDPTNPQAGILKPNSVDYIFADPPYGQDIQYFELDTLWNSWLGFKRDPAEEIIINENQGKDLDLYSLMLHRAFKQMFYVLKPNKRLTITFHNTDIKIRNALIRSAVFAGFELEKIIYQPPARPSAKQLLQPYGSAVGDYYIRFSKPKSYSTKKKVSDIDSELYEKIVVESVKKILAERGEPTAYTWIINTIDLELTKIGYNLKADPEDTKRILDKHKDKEFAVVEVIEGLNKVKRWWFKDPSIIKYLHRIPLSERIERSVIDVLRQNVVVHFDDILQTIFIEFPNSLTPETRKIIDVLEEYAEKVGDGKWKLKSSFKARENQHDTKIVQLVQIGKKLGYRCYFAHRQRDCRPDRLLNFKDITNMERVEEIDVIWFDSEGIKWIFEVENTTGITEAINRGSNISSGEVERVIVIPDERLPFLKRKIEEPMLKERVLADNWHFVTYNDVDKFLHKRIRNQDTFREQYKDLDEKPRPQKTFAEFY